MNEAVVSQRQNPSGNSAKNSAHATASLVGLDEAGRLGEDILNLALENRLLHQKEQRYRWLGEFTRQLVNITDRNVAAQKAAEWLQRLLECDFVSVFRSEPGSARLVLLSAVGPESARFREKMGERWVQFPHASNGGILFQAIRSGKIQVSSEPDATLERIHAGGRPFQSLMAVPLLSNGFLEGAILLADTRLGTFQSDENYFAEQICFHLTANWSQTLLSEKENEVVRAVATIPERNGPNESRAYSVLQEIAQIATRALKARMAVCALYEDPDWIHKQAGQIDARLIAPNSGLLPLLDSVVRSEGAFRVPDLRHDPRTSTLDFEDDALSSVVACRFSLNGEPAGAILALGCENGTTFNEKDEILIELIATHASMVVSRFSSNKELRNSLDNLSVVHEMNQEIARSRNLEYAIRSVALKAFTRFEAVTAGLALVRLSDGKVTACVQYPADDRDIQQPEQLIYQAISARERQDAPGRSSEPDALTTLSVYPILTQDHCCGALWLELHLAGPQYLNREDQIQKFVNQTAFALESAVRNHEISIRSDEITVQYSEISDAFSKLSKDHSELVRTNSELSGTYEQMIDEFVRALDAREGQGAAGEIRLGDLALLIGQKLGLDPEALNSLRYGANLHDIGKIGVPEHLFFKTEKLSAEEWALMRAHALKGAEIVRQVPGLQGASEIIANHHELWDGSGYPLGKAGTDIPLEARIVTVVDVYDAITNPRPYRKKALSHAEALDYLSRNAGILFDPEIVAVFKTIPEKLLRS